MKYKFGADEVIKKKKEEIIKKLDNILMINEKRQYFTNKIYMENIDKIKEISVDVKKFFPASNWGYYRMQTSEMSLIKQIYKNYRQQNIVAKKVRIDGKEQKEMIYYLVSKVEAEKEESSDDNKEMKINNM